MNWFKSYVFASYWWTSNFAGGGVAVSATGDDWIIKARRRGRR